MENSAFIQIVMVFIVFLVMWLAIKLIVYLKMKNTHNELWASIFEGITQNAIVVLEPLHWPESYIEKKAKRDGQDKDSNIDKDI